MSLKDLLLPFLSGQPEELSRQVEQVRNALFAIVDDLAAAATEPARTTLMLRKVERFPVEALPAIKELVSRGRRPAARRVSDRIEEQLQQLREVVKLPDTDQEPSRQRIIESLEALCRELKSIEAISLKTHRRFSLAVSSAYVLVPILGYWVGVLARLEHGLAPLTSDMVWPKGAYAQADATQTFRVLPHFQASYLAKFSPYYFQRSDTLPQPFVLEPENENAVNSIGWIGRTRNRSRNNSLLLSSVEVTVTYEEAPAFPWREMDVSPRLAIRQEPQSIVISDADLGPALQVRWQGETTSGMPLFAGQLWGLWRTQHTIQLTRTHASLVHEPVMLLSDWDEPTESRVEAKFDVNWAEQDGLLLQPLFWRLPEAPGTGELYFEVENIWFEKVETVGRLREITQVSHQESLRLRVEYESLLAGPPKIVEDLIALPNDAVYYERKTGLSARDPRVPNNNVVYSMAGGYGGMRDLPNTAVLLGALFPSVFEDAAPGEDRMELQVQVDVTDLRPGDQVVERLDPNQFLTARGLLVLQVQLDGVRQGRYSVEIRLRDDQRDAIIEKLAVETLLPEVTRFDESQVSRFR